MVSSSPPPGDQLCMRLHQRLSMSWANTRYIGLGRAGIGTSRSVKGRFGRFLAKALLFEGVLCIWWLFVTGEQFA